MSTSKSVKPSDGPHYTATRGLFEGPEVYVEATGHNVTGGFKTSFMVDFTVAHLTELSFLNIPPTGIANDLVTPFDISIAVTLPASAQTVLIHDTKGAHKVSITHARVLAAH
jgi:hypothetical protein